jgi:hypothetical protein
MRYRDGIPPRSDYAHWNEDQDLMWYEENKYDMMYEHERDYDDDPYDGDDYYDDED